MMEISITNNKENNDFNLNKINASLLTEEQQKTYIKVSILDYFHNKIVKKNRNTIDAIQAQEIYYIIYDIIYRIDDSLLKNFSDDSIMLLIEFMYLEASIKNISINKKDLYNFLKMLKCKIYNE